MKTYLKKKLPPTVVDYLRIINRRMMSITQFILTIIFRLIVTPVNRIKNINKVLRYLEIGPGPRPIKDFESINVVWTSGVSYIANASKKLFFKNNSFDLIYSSHMLEHVVWYEVEKVLQEWVRVLKPGGILELWVPDGLKICKAFVDAENGDSYIEKDGWSRFNPEKDPCLWACYRIFTYGDGTGALMHPNWHRAMFSERYLIELLKKVGLEGIRRLDPSEVRGASHGWINLGIRGVKPCENRNSTKGEGIAHARIP